MTTTTPSRWRTAATDSLGFVLVIWSIPLGIILVGLPIAALFVGARMIARWIW